MVYFEDESPSGVGSRARSRHGVVKKMASAPRTNIGVGAAALSPPINNGFAANCPVVNGSRSLPRRGNSNGHDDAAALRRTCNKRSVICRDDFTTSNYDNVTDYDYQLSIDLEQKQLEIAARKYGGLAKACRAAVVIQKAYREYRMRLKFERLRKRNSVLKSSSNNSKFVHSNGGMFVSNIEIDTNSDSRLHKITTCSDFLPQQPANPNYRGNTVFMTSGVNNRTDNRNNVDVRNCNNGIVDNTIVIPANSPEKYTFAQQRNKQRAVSVERNQYTGRTNLNLTPSVQVNVAADDNSARPRTNSSATCSINDGNTVRSYCTEDGRLSPVEYQPLLLSTSTRYVSYVRVGCTLAASISPLAADECQPAVNSVNTVNCINSPRIGDGANNINIGEQYSSSMSSSQRQIYSCRNNNNHIASSRQPPQLSPPPLEGFSTSKIDQLYSKPIELHSAVVGEKLGFAAATSSSSSLSSNSKARSASAASSSSIFKHAPKFGSRKQPTSSSSVNPTSTGAGGLSASKSASTMSPIWVPRIFAGPVKLPPQSADDSPPQAAECHLAAAASSSCLPPPKVAANIPYGESRLLQNWAYGRPALYRTSMRRGDLERRRQYRIALNFFNKKPERGIEFLICWNFVEGTPASVAKFLISRKGVSKQMIGEYLGNLQNPFNMAVLDCFAKEVDMRGMEIDVALRKFQSLFRLPGEAQKIERIVEIFAQRYCQCNPDAVQLFKQADTVFILAFAIIMLNTDLHSPSIKSEKRMKLDDFIKNLRGIDGGSDINHRLLTEIYKRMKEEPFKPGTDHVAQVAKVDRSIVGKKPTLALPHRRLVCYCRLYEILDPTKKQSPALHQREIFLFNDMIMITKVMSRKKHIVTYNFRQSHCLVGMQIETFKNQHYANGLQINLTLENKTLYFNARNEDDRGKFIDDLKEAILESDEMEALRIELELEKQNGICRTFVYNRPDQQRDSGLADVDPEHQNDTDRFDEMPNQFYKTGFSNSLLDLAYSNNNPISPSVNDPMQRHPSGTSLDSGMSSASVGSRESSPHVSGHMVSPSEDRTPTFGLPPQERPKSNSNRSGGFSFSELFKKSRNVDHNRDFTET